MDLHQFSIINLTVSELSEIIKDTVSLELERLLNEVLDEKLQDEFLTRIEASKILNLSLPTLTKYVKQGKIPAYRIGNRILFRKHEIINSAIEVQKRNLLNQ